LIAKPFKTALIIILLFIITFFYNYISVISKEKAKQHSLYSITSSVTSNSATENNSPNLITDSSPNPSSLEDERLQNNKPNNKIDQQPKKVTMGSAYNNLSAHRLNVQIRDACEVGIEYELGKIIWKYCGKDTWGQADFAARSGWRIPTKQELKELNKEDIYQIYNLPRGYYWTNEKVEDDYVITIDSDSLDIKQEPITNFLPIILVKNKL